MGKFLCYGYEIVKYTKGQFKNNCSVVYSESPEEYSIPAQTQGLFTAFLKYHWNIT